MKKLISVKDIENAEKQGQKVLYIDSETIITPSANDAARACGIEFSTDAPVSEVKSCCEEKASEQKSSCEGMVSELAKACEGGIDADMIYKVFKAMMDKGLLNGILDSVSNNPYIAETDSCGLKIVRGNSVKMEVLDTGNPNDKVFYQEIISATDGSSMNAGFITIEDCTFDWETACQEIYYVAEGTLTVTVNGKLYTANPGDSVFFPKAAKLAFGSPNKMKAFYVTY
jgi:ethanolamine utilization protein EutQ